MFYLGFHNLQVYYCCKFYTSLIFPPFKFIKIFNKNITYIHCKISNKCHKV